MNVFDRTPFDCAYHATVGWHDIRRAATAITYSHGGIVDDIKQIDGKWYYDVSGLIVGPFDTQDEAHTSAMSFLKARGEELYTEETP